MSAKRFASSVLLIAISCIGTLRAAEPTNPQNAEDPATLVANLNHDDFDTRQQANDKLAELGEAARSALEQAVAHKDPEIREAAKSLLGKLEKSAILVMAFDRDGKPAVDAQADLTIYRYQGGNKQENVPVTIQADGRALISGQAPGQANCNLNWKKWFVLYDAGNSYSSQELRPGLNPMMATLTRGGSVVGNIQDDAGKPLKDAQATLYSNQRFDPDLLEHMLSLAESWGTHGNYSASADAQGNFKIEALPDGVYQAVVKNDGYSPVLIRHVRVNEGVVTELKTANLKPRAKVKIQLLLQKADATPLKTGKVSVTLEPVLEGPEGAAKLRKIRRLRQQSEMRRNRQYIDTDEEGKLAIENIEPGKYRLLVRMDNDTPQDFGEVTVAAGAETADLGTFKFQKGGTVRGKVSSENGEGVKYASVSAIRLEEIEENSDPRYLQQYQYRGTYSQTQQDGKYELKNLAPGNYVLSIHTQTQRNILVYGVTIEAGKTANAPDVTVPDRKNTVEATNIKGNVQMPDGRPASGAQVSLTTAQGQYVSNSNCDDKGNFAFHYSNNAYPPTRMVVRVSKCKPAIIDLTNKELKLSELAIKLETQDYGSLKIKVTDEAGAPIAGAMVGPKAGNTNRYSYGGSMVYRRMRTNEDGIVRLPGLATGNRVIEVDRSGYYLPEEPKVAVVADAETEVAIKMKRGITQRGKLTLPAGFSSQNIMVGATRNNISSCRFSSVQENGEFALEGLPPGKHMLTVLSPGLGTTSIVEILIKDTQPEPEPLNVTLSRRAGAVLNVGEAYYGSSASLVPRAAWDPAKPEQAWTAARAMGVVDATGRLECWGSPPGEYYLILTPGTDNFRQYMGNFERYSNVQQVIGTLTVSELASVRDLPKMQPQPVKTPAATGILTGKLVLDPAPATVNYNTNGSIVLKIAGPNAVATTQYNYPSDFMAQASSQIIIGTPPANQKIMEPGTFTIRNLPPGEYKIYSELNLYQYRTARSFGGGMVTSSSLEAVDKKPDPVPLATVTIKEGETASVGTLTHKVVTPAPTPQGELFEAEDMMPVFQP